MSGFFTGLGVDIYPLFSTFQTYSQGAVYTFLLGIGYLSFIDRLLGSRDDDDDGRDDTEDSDGDDLFTADDDLEGLDALEEWETGDTFGEEFEDESSDVAELEPRVQDLENEIDSISSTVSTVRSENQAISDTVEDVEENVRKLLDVYELVTRGVNPFVDDVPDGSADTDSFDLFGGDEESTDRETTVAEEVLGADPEIFFGDDFDAGDGDDDGDAVDDGFDDSESDEPRTQADGDLESEDEVSGGKTFDDLKAEYETGEGEWIDGEGDGPFDSDDLEGGDVGFEFDQVAADASAGSSKETLDETVGDTIEANDGDFETTPGSVDAMGSGAGEVAANGNGSVPTNGDKPYLTRIPDGYSFDLLVMEWMEYLLQYTDTAGALRAIDYYRNIGWINDRVATDLTEVVRGFDANGDGSNGDHAVSDLSVDQHSHSLEYISQLDGRGIDVGLMTNRAARGK